MNIDKLQQFKRRLLKIDIKIVLVSNTPWVYLKAVNDHEIPKSEYYDSDHGYTIGYLPTKPGDQFDFLDIGRTFKLIRRYRYGLRPIHKYNNGNGATLCYKCRMIISVGFTNHLYCDRCKDKQTK